MTVKFFRFAIYDVRKFVTLVLLVKTDSFFKIDNRQKWFMKYNALYFK